ncbi:hypothetical protein M8J75_014230 [Diaphorina citri]|nr:hypothetical protein M8J75_014230 [Diaphorina citri]
MALSKCTQYAVSIVIILLLRCIINIINRVISCLFLCEDHDIFKCNLPVFLILLYLLSYKPCYFSRYARCLVCSELLLQLFILAWKLEFHMLLLCQIFPALGDSWLGNLSVVNLMGPLISLFTIGYCLLRRLEFTINWKPDCDCPPPSECYEEDDYSPPPPPPCCSSLPPSPAKVPPPPSPPSMGGYCQSGSGSGSGGQFNVLSSGNCCYSPPRSPTSNKGEM